jgi:bifunctional non-homologous end joining protein LigD
VIGWEAAPEHPQSLSSLVLAVHDGSRLTYAGRVGSGLAGREATRLKGLLSPRADPPVPDVPAPIRGRRLNWVQPEVVVDVQFTAWTDDRRLRNPVYRGVRTDKTVEEARGDG